MYHQWKQEVLETFCKIIDSYLFKWQPAPAFLPGESHGQRSSWCPKRVGHNLATKQQHGFSSGCHGNQQL